MEENIMSLTGEKIGVVTVTFGSAEVLPDFLESVFNQAKINYRLYAVDNASKDSTLAQLRQRQDERISVIENTINVGVARGNNQGIERALQDGCTHVLLLNNDVVFGSDLFRGMLAVMDENRADAVVPLMMFWQPSDRVWFGGGGFNWPRPYPSAHEYFGCLAAEVPQETRVIDYAPTCCMLVKREVFERIGLMDEDYFVYCDDTDFCFRMKAAGCRMHLAPKLRLFHKVSSLTGQESDFSIRFMTRNTVRFVRKHHGSFGGLLRTGLLAIHTLAHGLLGRSSWHKVGLKLKAISEGWNMPLSTRKDP
jgi:GT2 family glycosyltransferase